MVESLLCIEEEDAESAATGVDRPEEWYVATSVGRMREGGAEYVKLWIGAGRLCKLPGVGFAGLRRLEGDGSVKMSAATDVDACSEWAPPPLSPVSRPITSTPPTPSSK